VLVCQTRFVWDGDVLAHSIESRARAHGDPIIEERTYWFEEDGFEPVAHHERRRVDGSWEGDGWFHYVNDTVGTPERLIAEDGQIACELSRNAFGKTEVAAGATASTPIRFQGQYEDEETGLRYNRFRYYDPAIGRFISADPLGLAGRTNAFSYPTSPGWVDPWGLDWNYRLRDMSTNTVYYSGRASDKQTPAAVMARHAGTKGSDGVRFREGDQLEIVTPPGTKKKIVRGVEDGSIKAGGTDIKRRKCNGNKVRGNNIGGISSKNKNGPRYKAAAAAYLKSRGVGSAAELPTLSTHTLPKK
jgi:RHS repeat-associated protein